MSEQKWVKWCAVTVVAVGALLAFYLFFEYVLALLLPFLVAFSLAALTHSAAKRFSARTGLPQRLVATVFTFLALLLIGTAVYLVCSRLMFELQNFLYRLLSGESKLHEGLARIHELFERLCAGIPEELHGTSSLLSYFVGDVEVFFTERVKNWLTQLSERIPSLIGMVLGALPSILLFVIVTLIACFYFSVEYEKVMQTLSRLMPQRVRARMPELSQRFRDVALKYLRAYGLLFLITFTALVVGFLILRVEYVFLIALLVALLDALPILGLGTALIPWAVVSLILGNLYLGIGLIVLYVLITVLHHAIEPQLLGRSLGLHPILMLMALYAGLKLFGVIGAIVAPILAVFLKVLFTKESANTT